MRPYCASTKSATCSCETSDVVGPQRWLAIVYARAETVFSKLTAVLELLGRGTIASAQSRLKVSFAAAPSIIFRV